MTTPTPEQVQNVVSWLRNYEFPEAADIIEHFQARAIKAEERADAAEEKLHQISNWAHAYPTDMFAEVTDDDLKMANEKLGGDLVAKLHGSWGRHILEGVRDILNGDAP